VRRARRRAEERPRADVHLTAELVDALRELLRARRVVALDGATWVFPDRGDERPMRGTKHFLGDVFAPLCARLGLAGLRLHDLRHTWASIHLHERTELHEIQQQLGHLTPAFTLAVYGHLQPGDRRATMDRFSAALGRARGAVNQCSD
jgi:integrase